MERSYKTDIANPTFEVYGYINKLIKREFDNEIRWYCRASLIVDKVSSDEKPFVFQYVSLPVYGTALKLLESYQSEKGAERGFGIASKKVFLFRIKGYRVEKTDKPDFPFEIKGRIINIDEDE